MRADMHGYDESGGGPEGTRAGVTPANCLLPPDTATESKEPDAV